MYFKNADNTPCCDDSDCDPAPSNAHGMIGERVQTQRFGVVEINAVHPSPDGRRYICRTGCWFGGGWS